MKPRKELKAQLNDTLQRNGGKVELTHPVKVEETVPSHSRDFSRE